MSAKEKEIIEKLCDCDMNVSLVARGMHMHRNTVVYHLEKIKEKTGLNPLRFNDLVKLRGADIIDYDSVDQQESRYKDVKNKIIDEAISQILPYGSLCVEWNAGMSKEQISESILSQAKAQFIDMLEQLRD